MMTMTINMLIADDYDEYDDDEYDDEYGLCEWWVWGVVDHTVKSALLQQTCHTNTLLLQCFRHSNTNTFTISNKYNVQGKPKIYQICGIKKIKSDRTAKNTESWRFFSFKVAFFILEFNFLENSRHFPTLLNWVCSGCEYVRGHILGPCIKRGQAPMKMWQ